MVPQIFKLEPESLVRSGHINSGAHHGIFRVWTSSVSLLIFYCIIPGIIADLQTPGELYLQNHESPYYYCDCVDFLGTSGAALRKWWSCTNGGHL